MPGAFPHPGFVTESTPLQSSWRGDAGKAGRGEAEQHGDSFSPLGMIFNTWMASQ